MVEPQRSLPIKAMQIQMCPLFLSGTPKSPSVHVRVKLNRFWSLAFARNLWQRWIDSVVAWVPSSHGSDSGREVSGFVVIGCVPDGLPHHGGSGE